MPSVLIIGASRGIGREFVRQYLEDGWDVHGTARTDEDLDALKAAGAKARKADTTDEESLRVLADDIAEPLDLVIANAGVGSNGMEGPMSDVDADDWMRVMRVNALGPLLALRNLMPKLSQPGGTAAILSSRMGSIEDNQMGGFWSYRMSKAAANAAIKNLALAYEPQGVGIVALHPGWVQTDMGGKGADIAPETSVAGMRKVLAAKRPGDGTLFADYRGQRLPW